MVVEIKQCTIFTKSLSILSLFRWPCWKPTPTCLDSPSSSPSCTASSSFLPSRTVRSQQSVCVEDLTTKLSVCPSASPHHHLLLLLLRYPVLEQQTVSRRPLCALHHLRSLSVSGGAALHPGQRDQLRGAGQRLHRASHRPVEDHQGHGRQGKSDQHLFDSCTIKFVNSIA